MTSRIACVLLGSALLTALSLGCAESPDSVDPRTLATSPRSGVQLWADNCARCHATRAPTAYSDAQWDLVVHHMRLQAHLTGAEQRSIAAFLKTAN